MATRTCCLCCVERRLSITQSKAHRPCEAGEKEPQQNPAAAGRHRQAQHHTDTGRIFRDRYGRRDDKGQHYLHSSKALVLPRKGIEREADQKDSQQQPGPAARKLGWNGWASRNQKLSHTAEGTTERRLRSATAGEPWAESERLD